MGVIPAATFLNFFIYLLIPFLLGFVAKKFRIPPIIGYIIGGIALGNIFQGLISPELINNFAYFGIILLLFTVGLDVNLEKLFLLKKYIIIGGIIQIVISAVAITFLSLFFGFSLLQSFLIALAFTSSSTSVVAKIIQDRGEEDSFIGEITIGILMFQDLAFVPFIIIFNQFGNGVISYFEVVKDIAFGLAEAALILWAMYYLGRKIVPKLFNRIAKTSRELLNLFIIVFIFAIASLSASFGVPILVGAFIAGVLVSQTLEHYHIFSQIRPLRDLMAIIFFVYIGTHVKIPQIIPLIPQILLFGSMIVLVKAAILLIIFLYFKFSSRMAFALAVFLFQISENAFILLSLAYANKIYDSKQYLFIISAVLFSLMLTPIVITSKDRIYAAIRGFFKRFVPVLDMFIKNRIDFDQTHLEAFNIKEHVVICGYGRIGSHVGRALSLANIPFVAVDYNFRTVERAKREGINIIYGDPTDLDVLDFAETENALVLISALPGETEQEAVVMNAKRLNPKIFLISRAHQQKDQQRMKDLGVHSVVQPEVEASLSIIKKIFLLKHMPKEEIVKQLQHLRLIHAII